MFSLTDGACYCKSGYIFYNQVDTVTYEENSDKDCQLIVSGAKFIVCLSENLFPAVYESVFWKKN